MLKQDSIQLRRLIDNDKDYKLLEKWYQQEEVYLHFEQRKLNYHEIKEKYYPRTLDDTKIPVYIIESNNIPLGIIQYKLINEEDKKLYRLKNDNSYELDIFIGELNYHNKGIGTKTINIMSKYLFEEKHANLLVMCPLKDNFRAIKFYKKCGFIEKYLFKTKDTIGKLQEYILMIKENK